MVAFAVFTIMALGVLAAMVQIRKMSESNVAQATAEAIAQGIIEQVHLLSYTTIATTDVADPSYSATLPLKFVGATSGNLASVQTFNLTWAPDATTFSAIGERVDPTDPASAVLGILLDMDYRSGATVLRPKRYMQMRVNLQRTPDAANDNVKILLTFRWSPPGRTGASASDFITREIRTVRSQAQSY